MTTKNRYFRRSEISEAKFRQIVRHFALDLTATECAALTGILVCSVNAIYRRICKSLASGVPSARRWPVRLKPMNNPTLAHDGFAVNAGGGFS